MEKEEEIARLMKEAKDESEQERKLLMLRMVQNEKTQEIVRIYKQKSREYKLSH